MTKRFAYSFKLSDDSSGTWITDIKPPDAGYALGDRFPGRCVTAIKRIN